MRHCTYRVILFMAVLMANVTMPITAQALITLHYYERPPYLVRQQDGSARGLTADVARHVFNAAGIPFRWSMTPAKRQLSLIEHNSGADCGIGWLRNAQRAAYAQFSAPIYRDLPPVVLVHRRVNLQPTETLTSVLENQQLRVLIKDGLTYGSYIAAQVALAKAKVERVSITQSQLFRMVAAGRADLMFATQAEARLLVTNDEAGERAVKVRSFPDIPAGEYRYLMCSKKVSHETMNKLNQAIAALPSLP